MSKDDLHIEHDNLKLYYFKALLLGLGFAALFWLAETFMHYFIFEPGLSFFQQLYPENTNEFWMRAFICALFIFITLRIAYTLQQKFWLTLEIKLAHMAFNTMREGAIITNSDNKMIYINSTYTTITGYTPKEVLGKNPSILSSGKQGSAFYKKLWSALNTEGYWEGEIWNRKKSGELYPEWMMINAVKDKKNKTQYHVAVFSDITSRKASEAKIKHYAFYDPLTDLPNRRFFMERLKQSIKLAKRTKQQLAVLFIDLDHFKNINDQYGHDAGDQFLVEISTLLKENLRETDTVSRFGGDEFVIFLSHIQSKNNAVQIASQLLEHLKQSTITLSKTTLKPQASIGGAMYPDDTSDAETLIQYADKAMYQVKETTRQGLGFYHAKK
jgi:diguanylate cyclase (GGDEF)-like protein/PAS domain S-box-containing protein